MLESSCAVASCWERDRPQRREVLDELKSSTLARRRSPRGRFERELAVGSRLACLGAAACALQRPLRATLALPP